MNIIQKAFEAKNTLRGMTEFGGATPAAPKPLVPAAPTTAAPAPAPIAAPSRLATAGKFLSNAGTAVAAGLEAKNVYDVAKNPNASGIDIATQAFEGTGKLAAAGVGAAYGSAVLPVVGTAIGGVGGYFGGDRVADAGRAMGETPNSIAAGTSLRAIAPTLPYSMGAFPNAVEKVGQFMGALTDAPDSTPATSLRGMGTGTPPPTGPGSRPHGGFAPQNPNGVGTPAQHDEAMGNLRQGRAPGYGFAKTGYGTAEAPIYQNGRSFVGVGKPPAPVDPLDQQLQTALRDLSNPVSSQSAPQVQSGAKDINARFDKLASDMAGRYGPEGQGNLSKRMMELESMRAAALEADASNGAAMRGQDMNASANNDTLRQQARGQQLDALTTLANQRALRQSAAATKIAELEAEAQGEAAKAQTKAEEDGYKRYVGNVGRMFQNVPEDQRGAAQEKFESFVAATDPDVLKENADITSIEDLMAMKPQEQAYTMQKLRNMQEMQETANESRTRGMFWNRPTSTALQRPVGKPREYAAIDDVVNGGLPLSDSVKNFFLPWRDDRVQDLEDGSVVRVSEYLDGSQDKAKIAKSLREMRRN